MVALHRLPPGEEFTQPGELWRAAVLSGRLHHGGEREQRVCAQRNHRHLAVRVHFLDLFAHYMNPCPVCALLTCFPCFARYDEDKKQWEGMIREMRYAAGATCVSMRLNAAKMPKL